MEATQDPQETGAAPWQERAAEIASRWAEPLIFEQGGVDLARVMEYIIVEQVNRRYVEARNDGADEARPANAG